MIEILPLDRAAFTRKSPVNTRKATPVPESPPSLPAPCRKKAGAR
jgi:hypothetical protein